jgi:hypothetical protein
MLTREIKRYREKGLGFFVAIGISLIFFVGWHKLMMLIWPAYMLLKAEYNLSDTVHMFLFSFTQHIIVFGVGNVLAYSFYHY